METEILKSIVLVQSDIISILCLDYNKEHRSPIEKDKINELSKTLKDLLKKL